MKIAVMSDSHDNIHNLVKALKICLDKEVDQILFLGDLINPGLSDIFADFPIPIHMIFGNNEGDSKGIMERKFKPGTKFTLASAKYDLLEYDNKKVFITHFPRVGMIAAKSGEFNYVFYGHDHTKSSEKIGNTWLINPGEISAHKSGKCEFIIWNTKDDSIEDLEVKDAVLVNTEEVKKIIKSFK
jgi:uncharacterized protein